MCPPEYFTVAYAINPWMDVSRPIDTALAWQQWEALRRTYLDLGHTVQVIAPVPGLPDMVFAANGGPIEWVTNLDKTGEMAAGLTYVIFVGLAVKYAAVVAICQRWARGGSLASQVKALSSSTSARRR